MTSDGITVSIQLRNIALSVDVKSLLVFGHRYLRGVDSILLRTCFFCVISLLVMSSSIFLSTYHRTENRLPSNGEAVPCNLTFSSYLKLITECRSSRLARVFVTSNGLMVQLSVSTHSLLPISSHEGFSVFCTLRPSGEFQQVPARKKPTIIEALAGHFWSD